MGLKEEFLKLETPGELIEFMKNNKDLQYDAEMAKHFNEIAKKHSNGETYESHSDPKEAFIRSKRTPEIKEH
jgi:hypothetical protein